MTGRELAEKFGTLESQIAKEKGAFAFFALFLREDAPHRWDLIVSAPWIGGDARAAVDYFVSQIKSRLGEQEILALSRIIVADPGNAALQALTREIEVEHGRVEVRDTDFFGQSVKHAYFITSKQPATPAAA
jgi:hypothetical protein